MGTTLSLRSEPYGRRAVWALERTTNFLVFMQGHCRPSHMPRSRSKNKKSSSNFVTKSEVLAILRSSSSSNKVRQTKCSLYCTPLGRHETSRVESRTQDVLPHASHSSCFGDSRGCRDPFGLCENSDRDGRIRVRCSHARHRGCEDQAAPAWLLALEGDLVREPLVPILFELARGAHRREEHSTLKVPMIEAEHHRNLARGVGVPRTAHVELTPGRYPHANECEDSQCRLQVAERQF